MQLTPPPRTSAPQSLLVRAGRAAINRARRATAEIPIGDWSLPADGGVVGPGACQLEGWALPSRTANQVRVLVLHGTAEVAETVAGAPRPDVAAAYGPAALNSGWQLCIDLDGRSEGDDVIEVVVDDGTGRHSLGRRRLVRSGPAQPGPGPRGHGGVLDQPVDGQQVNGSVLPVHGWVFLDGGLADVVEIYLDDAAPIRARRCEARPDLIASVSVAPGIAIAGGFSELVPLSLGAGREQTTIVVRAWNASGAEWQSGPVTVKLSDELHDRHRGPLVESPFHRPSLPGAQRARGRRPRVCALTHSLFFGGGELYLQELLLRLADKDVADLRVISPVDGPLRAPLESAGIGVHLTQGYPTDRGGYAAKLAELGTLLTEWECDLVIANTLGVFLGVDAALHKGIPTVWAIHESFDLDVFTYLNWGAHELHPDVRERFRAVLAEANLLVFESEATRRLFASAIPGIQTRCLRYGVNLEQIAGYEQAHDRAVMRSELGFAPDERVLVCMGVLQDRKAQLALVEAFAELVDTAPSARLVLVGDHPSAYAAAVREAVALLGRSDAVSLVPVDPDPYRWYRCADVLVSASDTESLPRSVLEAMAFGVPVLAANVFGLPEVVVDGANGWLCEPRDGAALLTGLRRALSCTAEQLAALSTRCREDARAFDGDGYAQAFAEIIQSVDELRSRG